MLSCSPIVHSTTFPSGSISTLNFSHYERRVAAAQVGGLLDDDVEVDAQLEVCGFSVLHIPCEVSAFWE